MDDDTLSTGTRLICEGGHTIFQLTKNISRRGPMDFTAMEVTGYYHGVLDPAETVEQECMCGERWMRVVGFETIQRPQVLTAEGWWPPMRREHVAN